MILAAAKPSAGRIGYARTPTTRQELASQLPPPGATPFMTMPRL